jgi:hypothetical protein
MNNEEYNEWEQFVQSLIDNKDKRLLMTHKPYEVRYVDKYFPGYLTEEELQERQFTGRFWALSGGNDDTPFAMLFIIADNETVLYVERDRNGKDVSGLYVFNRSEVLSDLPDCLRGCYYNDN